jgi:transcriptional regulator with XRE-family HTH domain
MVTKFYLYIDCSSNNTLGGLRQNLSGQHAEHLLRSKIYELRKEKRWSLKHLSTLSGVPYNTIWRMERGYGTALTNAYKVAAAFQSTVYELWFIPPSGTIPIPNEPDVSSVTELRLKRGWGLRDLAELSRIPPSTLFAIEKGQIPKLGNALRIAAALEVSVYQIWKPRRDWRE